MNEISIMDLRIVGIVCMTAMAIAALIVDGSMGEMLMTAVAGGIGVAVGWMFGKAACEEVVKDEEEVQK
jgi:hypothetical protein